MSPDRAWRPIDLPDEFPAPAGAYSPGVRAGSLIFVSGQIPKNPRTGKVEREGIVEQSRQTLENVRLVLEAGGATLDDVVSVTVYLEDEKDWGAFNDVYTSIFRPPYPARAVVGARLRGILVEISAIAFVR